MPAHVPCSHHCAAGGGPSATSPPSCSTTNVFIVRPQWECFCHSPVATATPSLVAASQAVPLTHGDLAATPNKTLYPPGHQIVKSKSLPRTAPSKSFTKNSITGWLTTTYFPVRWTRQFKKSTTPLYNVFQTFCHRQWCESSRC